MIKKNITLIFLKIFDYYHNKKIINFLKKKITHINILLDIGAHKGESVNLFINNFSVHYIHSFEPSLNNYNELKKNIFNYKKKFKKINFKIKIIGVKQKFSGKIWKKCDWSYANLEIIYNKFNDKINYFVLKNKLNKQKPELINIL